MNRLGPSLRRAKFRERPVRRAAVALLASLVLNALGFALLVGSGAFDLPSPRDVKPVALAPVSPEQWAANRAVRNERQPPARIPPPIPEPEPEEEAKGQVVDVAPSEDRTPPRNARFLSEQDGSVERETRSRHARAGYERTLPLPASPGATDLPPPGVRDGGERTVPGAEGPRAPPAGERPAHRLALAPGGDGDLAVGAGAAPRGSAPPAPGAGEGGERLAGEPGDRPLIPPGTLARIAGGPAPDHLQDVEEGEGTYLNTRGFKYATYFNRIKQAVAATWDPLSPLDARDPDRRMFGTRDRYTLLGVTLDDTGRLKSLVVEQTSGVEFLDRAALGAFRAAQPFVNPPRGVADANGEIRFSFGFFLEVGRSGLRIYRAPIQRNP